MAIFVEFIGMMSSMSIYKTVSKSSISFTEISSISSDSEFKVYESSKKLWTRGWAKAIGAKGMIKNWLTR